MKKCSRCKETKPYSEFHKNSTTRDGYSYHCGACRCEYYREKNNTDQHRTRARTKYANSPEMQLKAKKNWLRSRFGIEYEDYMEMIERQDNKCAICGREENRKWRNKISRELAVDHDHESGKVRGLLCASCNTAIGLMQDDVTLLAKAIDYLQSHRLKIVA